MESHTDILAQAAGMDPFIFRMNNLTDERMIRVLNAAADKFGHNFNKSPSGKGYGISCTNYLNSYVATIAHVSVNKSTGQVKIERVVCAQDMGEIINPRGAKLQIEGGITMGLSAALKLSSVVEKFTQETIILTRLPDLVMHPQSILFWSIIRMYLHRAAESRRSRQLAQRLPMQFMMLLEPG
jgi:CO/xanthine dehydrogenase Mo-binding subunit